jgi:drug/metabolite transporter (DMT)-like permease
MGRLDNLPNNFDSDDAQSVNQALKAVTQDLRALQQDLVAQLGQDVKRLQAEKLRLLNDIESLKTQHQTLESEHQALLSQRQIAQQQLWAKQLAQALATHLHGLLVQRINQQVDGYSGQTTPGLPPAANEASHEDAYRLLSSLDSTLNRTLSSLRQDLNSYQSALSQQIGRMQNLEQQGEVILETLVARLSQQLQTEVARHQQFGHVPGGDRLTPPGPNPYAALTGQPATGTAAPPAPYPNVSGYPASPSHPGYVNGQASHPNQSYPGQSSPPRPKPPAPAPSSAPGPSPAAGQPRSFGPWKLSQFWLGFWLIVLSTLSLSLHNVVVKIIGNQSHLFGVFDLGGYISLTSLGNSLLILFMRMAIVAPGMAILAGFLYPPVWRDIKAFVLARDRRLLTTVVGSGLFLFLSQVLIYIAFGEFRNPGIPVTILFMYPIITVPLAWILFGDRPTRLRIGVMTTILFGVVLTAFPSLTAAATISWQGIITAVTSGIAFAFYLIFMQSSFRKLHPVPVSVIQFSTIFCAAGLCLLLPLGPKVLPNGAGGLFAGILVLSTLTLSGYLLNNFGVRFMGAAQASILASSGPVITALLSWLIIGAPLKQVQGFGILIVTLGVIALGVEKMLAQRRMAKAAK